MPTLKTYQKPEEAYIDAGLLCSMGIDAVVLQDPAYGGALLGVMESPHRLEVPEDQMERATSLLSPQPAETIPPPQVASTPIDATRIQPFFRIILIYDTICFIVFPFFGHLIFPDPPPEVAEYLATLYLSDVLWRLSYASFWPLVALSLISNVCCFFYVPLGRSLFAITTVLSMVMHLGPPPMIVGAYYNFFFALQTTLASIALALMFWSPLRERFHKPTKAGG